LVRKSGEVRKEGGIKPPLHENKEGRSAILSLSSAAAPLGDGSIAERNYRGGISEVDPHPARLNLRAQCGALRSLWLNPALCGSPVYRREAKSGKKKCLRTEYLLYV